MGLPTFRAAPGPATAAEKRNGGVAAPVSHHIMSPREDYGSDGVFSAKYSWLSALSSARVGLDVARLLQALWP